MISFEIIEKLKWNFDFRLKSFLDLPFFKIKWHHNLGVMWDPGDFEIHGTSKDLIRETSRKVVSMNNRYAMFPKSTFADLAAWKRRNHLLRIIIESRFIIPASLQAPRLASNILLSDRSVLQTVSPLNRPALISPNSWENMFSFL